MLTHPVLFIDPIILDDMQRKCDVDCFMVLRKIFDVATVYTVQHPCNDLLSPIKYFKLESFMAEILEATRFIILSMNMFLCIM